MGASAPWRLSDAGTSVDKGVQPDGFIKVSINAAYQLYRWMFGLFAVSGRRVFKRVSQMPFSNPAERGQEIFGPDTVAVLAAALEDAVRQLRLVDRNDPVVTMVAKTIIELARRGERDPIRLRDQAIQSFR